MCMCVSMCILYLVSMCAFGHVCVSFPSYSIRINFLQQITRAML